MSQLSAEGTQATRLEQTTPRVIPNHLYVAHVAAKGVHRLVPRHVHHPKQIGTALRCRREWHVSSLSSPMCRPN